MDIEGLDIGISVVVTADGQVPLTTCDVKAVDDAEGKVPDDQVVYVHDVLLIVLLFEVAIFDVVLLLIDANIVPSFCCSALAR